MRKVAPSDTGCLLWLGGKSSAGYGRIRFLGKLHSPHRVMLAASLGRRLRRNEDTCHRRDVPACVNPEHLFPGSRRANVLDMVAKGRRRAGTLSAEGRAAIAAANRRRSHATCKGCGRFLSSGRCRNVLCVESDVLPRDLPARAEGR